MTLKEIEEAETRLLAALNQARQGYEQARREFDESSLEAYRIGLSHVDGAYLIHKTGRRYHEAVTEYREALHRFADLVLRNKKA